MEYLPGKKITGIKEALKLATERQSNEVFASDSIETLAQKAGMTPAVLKATVEAYNSFCKKGHDDLFNKNLKYLWPIRGQMFYAAKVHTISLGTLGGIKINHRMEVIDKKDRVIPGLYAVGNDAGGMYGDSYPIEASTGGTAAFAINSGRIAGENALKYLGK